MTESALRVFTEELDEHELSKEIYWTYLLTKQKECISSKLSRISNFIRYPLPIVPVTDSILNDYFKVFEGKNRFFNISSENDITSLKKWISLYKPEKWIEENAREVLKNKPCTFVVVDRKNNGEPYLIDVDSTRVIDADIISNEGQCGYIIFTHSVEEVDDEVKAINYSVYDDESYRVFRKETDTDIYTLVSETKHSLGYCPARMFVGTQSNSVNSFKRRVSFSPIISKLEDWTVFDIFRNYTDYYVPFPVTESAVKKCQNDRCKGGKEEIEIVNPITNERTKRHVTCGVCEGKDLSAFIGPGTHIGIKLQADKTKEDGSGKFKMHFPETDKIKHVPEKLEALELEIKYKTVGVSNVLMKEAVNEQQVKGSFTSMESVLMRNKTQLDDLYKWIVNTVSGLFYKNISISVEANFGTEFYLISEDELQERLRKAKENGLPKSEQFGIYEQLIETKYKGNSEKIERQKLILHLDPLPLYTHKEVMEMAKEGAIDMLTLNFKINFYKFVTEFELDNGSITDFGSQIEPSEKIRIIQEQLNNKNNENYKSQQARASNEGDREPIA